jgi:ATP-dependent DNA ligase
VILSSLTAEDAQVVERIIGKDLKVGASESTFNKVWPGLVHEYPCMLCSAYDKKLVDKIKFPALVQKKEDGMRFNAIVKNGDVEFRSRNGKEIQLLGNLELEFLVMANGSNIVFDGELLVANEDGTIADRQTGNGILNKANKGTITPELAKMVRAQIWDMIDYDKFHAGVDNTPYIDRWNKLLGCANTSNGKIGYVETIVVANLEAAEVQFEAYLEDGFEGIILKDSNAIWEDKRSKKQVKFKGEEEADLLVYDVYLGEPGSKYEGMIGGVSVKSRDGILKVNVGSGFSDEQRKQDPALLMNKIVAVKYNMRIKNKQGEESLFLPIFIEVREDKDLADTNEMIK